MHMLSVSLFDIKNKEWQIRVLPSTCPNKPYLKDEQIPPMSLPKVYPPFCSLGQKVQNNMVHSVMPV